VLISAIADFGRTPRATPVLISAIADFGRTPRATPGADFGNCRFRTPT
jgi:hypothetical protein